MKDATSSIGNPIPFPTWNIHRAKGADGRVDPERIVHAIATDIMPLAPRILALQEADSEDLSCSALLDPEPLFPATQLPSVHEGTDMRWSLECGGFLGNLLLLGQEFEITARRIAEFPGHCPRAAVFVETQAGGRALRVVSCHLSLSRASRALQLRLIGQVIARGPTMQTLLLGDLNEWRPWGGLALSLHITGLRLGGPTRRTFPSSRPLLPLDRILTDRKNGVRVARAVAGAVVGAASDHLPLTARLTLPKATPA